MRPRYFPSLSLPDIYLYRPPIDFRKQANSLAALVELRSWGIIPSVGRCMPLQPAPKSYQVPDVGRQWFRALLKALAEEKFRWPGLGRPDFAHRRAINWFAGWLRSQPDAATQNLHYDSVASRKACWEWGECGIISQ